MIGQITQEDQRKILALTLPQLPQGTFVQRNKKFLIFMSVTIVIGVMSLILAAKF